MYTETTSLGITSVSNQFMFIILLSSVGVWFRRIVVGSGEEKVVHDPKRHHVNSVNTTVVRGFNSSSIIDI